MKTINISTDKIICDYCNEDYTNSEELGGFLFGSYATCPKCVPRIERLANKNDELPNIRARAKPNQTFKNFLEEIRSRYV